MEAIYKLWIVIVSLIVVKLCHLIYQWSNPKCNGKLPPGSMGFPIIGETIEFMKPHDALQYSNFLKKRILRHGPLFRTSLFGGKVIISTDNELNMEMAKTNRIPGITKSLARLFGEDNNLFLQSTESHKHARNLTLQLLGSQGLKLRILEDIDILARTYMSEEARNGTLDVKETASKIIIECLGKKVMGNMEPEAAKKLALCWRYFPSGWFRLPFKIPGMGIYNMMKARKTMKKLLKEEVLKKRASGEEFGEFFKIIFGENKGGKERMSMDHVIEYIYTFFVIANETTPRILAATIKLISENSEVMQELQREHARIVGDKTAKQASLTWEDYKSMTFTNMVINESLRISTTVPVILRKPDHDIKVGDYTIPAGWNFMGYPSVHFNPEKYEDPLVFNPWRWKGKDVDAILSKNYVPFGAGPRLCVGAYFAKLLMAIFIHHLCRYRWSMKADITITRSYMLMFPRGCDVQISEENKV
ncbi:PREDICTED: cytochrome P450 708A2-like [Camelina sativa]|uniref:Cytochrome P450 708A2-like n=1 Tax=Camelina sativa TaxID=90675 RepID=A0ABM0Z8K1_CAMSA|nr:PREDICTED: cytochrome P450 708A2-like [Camelina sativa]